MPEDMVHYLEILVVASMFFMLAAPALWILSKLFKSQRLYNWAILSLVVFMTGFASLMLILIMMSKVYKTS